ncbi:TPA: hypothetical protein VDA67_001895 [Burkholderia vietnamiensis]|nr:hypothetical protein [Burkholderia vietnamiensis]HEP6283563.1 hypothetical protein [Burkholderia vietnamiensis]HEP6309033.1 hypothetical protein [Burkholderia vietnamiensis]
MADDTNLATVDPTAATAPQNLSDQLSAAVSNPNVGAYLRMLSAAEGTASAANPYAVGFGGKPIDDLSAHPGTSTTFTQTDGKQSTTSAAGAYQFERATWQGIQKALNLPDFGPRSQDIGALYLMHQNGSLSDVLNGNYSAAIQKDGKTWASLPTSPYAQPKRSQPFVANALTQAHATQPSGTPASTDLSMVPAPKLLAAYQRASAAQDSDAMGQLSDALGPRLLDGLQRAQSANDPDAVNQIQEMIAQLHPAGASAGSPPTASQDSGQATPQGNPARPARSSMAQPQRAPLAVPGTADNVGPPASSKNPSMGEALGQFANQMWQHPGAALSNIGSALAKGAQQIGHGLETAPLHTVDSAVRGAADGLTFGAADKLAALAESVRNGTSYQDELLKQRQQDQAGGSAFTAGQLAAPLVPGAGAVSLAGKAAELVPTASKIARMAAGAVAGGVEGGASYLGHNDGQQNPDDLNTAMTLGAAGGMLPGLFTGPTQAQRAAQFLQDTAAAQAATGPKPGLVASALKQLGTLGQTGAEANAGAMAAAQRDAGIIQDLSALQNRATQGGTKLGAADANALANGYTQQAGASVRQLVSNGVVDQQSGNQLLGALQGARGLNDDQIAGIRNMPGLPQGVGDAVADAIQQKQRTLAMTAAVPMSSNPLLGVARMAVDNGALHFIPGIGPLLNLKSIREGITGLLGGRENRTANIAQALGRADNAGAFLAQQGPGRAVQSAAGLAQMARSAQAARAAAQASQQTAASNSQANAFIGRGMQAAAAQRAALAQEPAQRIAAAQAATQAAAAQQQRNTLQAATRMPLGGGYQTLLQGGQSGLNLTPQQANAGLRILSNHPVLGPIANEMRQTGGVADPTQFYALQNGLRGLQSNGAIPQAASPALQAAQQAQASSVRNPTAYAATVARNQKMVDTAVTNAPSPKLAMVAHQLGGNASTTTKQMALDAVMRKASPSEQNYLRTFVQPLVKYGT